MNDNESANLKSSIVSMAKEFLITKYWMEHDLCSKNVDGNMPTPPSTENIIEESEKIWAFVSK